MNEKPLTLLRLEAAFERLSDGLSPGKKLSIRAIETEACLGNGSAYYYPEFIKAVRARQTEIQEKDKAAGTGIKKVRGGEKDIAELVRLKRKLHDEVVELRKLNAQIAADQYRQMAELEEAHLRIRELEETVADLMDQLVEYKRKAVVSLSGKSPQ
ncbi:hypothetical protein [Klebsiella aerogenes]|uniref:hypothetical protein n=1 Tax=Klebsiella aerogenes TaxID=548 RepID=UPI001F2B753D|nr:hypothetical protein [Klebsiella aerogenes]